MMRAVQLKLWVSQSVSGAGVVYAQRGVLMSSVGMLVQTLGPTMVQPDSGRPSRLKRWRVK